VGFPVQNAHESTGQGALVAIDEGRVGMAARPRPLAGFVTQLLACYGDVPAYRARRRVEPEVATACYGAAPATPDARFERWL
jgi:hypothetical protein